MKTRLPFFATMIGSGFGSGFWPWGPGTAGALLATVVWMVLGLWLPATMLMWTTLGLCVVFTIVGTWATARLQPYWGDDPSRVVVDEMVGVWVPLVVCPHGSIAYAATAFVLFRFFDILKPLGIRALDRRVGAFWVMADDLLAGIYSLIVIIIIKCI